MMAQDGTSAAFGCKAMGLKIVAVRCLAAHLALKSMAASLCEFATEFLESNSRVKFDQNRKIQNCQS
jgi:hypothetical protein